MATRAESLRNIIAPSAPGMREVELSAELSKLGERNIQLEQELLTSLSGSCSSCPAHWFRRKF